MRLLQAQSASPSMTSARRPCCTPALTTSCLFPCERPGHSAALMPCCELTNTPPVMSPPPRRCLPSISWRTSVRASHVLTAARRSMRCDKPLTLTPCHRVSATPPSVKTSTANCSRCPLATCVFPVIRRLRDTTQRSLVAPVRAQSG